VGLHLKKGDNMTYSQLRDLEKQLDKARIAVIMNLNAYDDDLAETYEEAQKEVNKVIAMAVEIFKE
jgi:hypothetical protein